ncbi:DNA polymerase family A-domain-containing protein [Paraphysoderma sedebokerense]|nr:DNA polymerase family A-domain-containing protein [Paraphysoderma sedebokerense]
MIFLFNPSAVRYTIVKSLRFALVDGQSKCRSNAIYCGPLLRIIQHRQYSQSHLQEETKEAVIKDGSHIRRNALNIQMLPPNLHSQVFPPTSPQRPPLDFQVSLSKSHLMMKGIPFEKSETLPDVSIQLSKLQGRNLQEHFDNIGNFTSEPYLDFAKSFVKSLIPPKPSNWIRQPGWTRYHSDGRTESIPYPDDEALVFDVETAFKISKFPIIAVAMSSKYWYSWISPWMLSDGKEKNSVSDKYLIPLGKDNERIIIGHNIGYDRARILEEYHLTGTKNAFIDTLSLHVAHGGMCSRQRPTFMTLRKERGIETVEGLDVSKFNGDREWANFTALNSLAECANLYLGVELDKSIRDELLLGAEDFAEIQASFDDIMNYCASDVEITFKIFQIVFPHYIEKCPHPASFTGMLKISSGFLPVTEGWPEYLERCESLTNEWMNSIQEKLKSEAYEVLHRYIIFKEEDRIITDTPPMTAMALEHYTSVDVDWEKLNQDPWLRQLDWTTVPPAFSKKGKPLRRKLPNYPKWFKDCWDNKIGDISITHRNQIAPYLFRLKWNNCPLYFSKEHKWTVRVDPEAVERFAAKTGEVDINVSIEPNVADDIENGVKFYKLPHKDGEDKNTGSPFSKFYTQYFESGVLTSDTPAAKEALDIQVKCSYWVSARERIKGQFVVWDNEVHSTNDPNPIQNITGIADRGPNTMNGVILPQTIPMGTVTRRSSENTWMTASNAKKNRVGSELKSNVKAPPGWKIIGADVDSEELWIASVFGDSQFRMHGATALGWMTLQGTKAAGTDLHSRTAEILGISRDKAKIFNYARIYGAGLKFATQVLKQFSNLSDAEVQKKVEELYEQTKGFKAHTGIGLRKKGFWMGGTESYMFNCLEAVSFDSDPRTPVLGCGITEALKSANVKNQYLTSRVNWVVQSSGVDYLHLLLTSMEYLCRKYNICARFMLSIHDEVRFLVKEEDQYRAAMALQVSNLWTRALFSYKIGLDDLPLSVAFFSAVDIDFLLRKETNDPCISPTQLTPIPNAESLDIYELITNHPEKSDLGPPVFPDFPTSSIAPPVPSEFQVFSNVTDVESLERWLKVQMCSNLVEAKNMLRERKKGNVVETAVVDELITLDDGLPHQVSSVARSRSRTKSKSSRLTLAECDHNDSGMDLLTLDNGANVFEGKSVETVAVKEVAPITRARGRPRKQKSDGINEPIDGAKENTLLSVDISTEMRQPDRSNAKDAVIGDISVQPSISEKAPTPNGLPQEADESQTVNLSDKQLSLKSTPSTKHIAKTRKKSEENVSLNETSNSNHAGQSLTIDKSIKKCDSLDSSENTQQVSRRRKLLKSRPSSILKPRAQSSEYPSPIAGAETENVDLSPDFSSASLFPQTSNEKSFVKPSSSSVFPFESTLEDSR